MIIWIEAAGAKIVFDVYTPSIHSYGAMNRKENCSNKILLSNGEDLFLSLWVCGQKILVPTPKEWYLSN